MQVNTFPSLESQEFKDYLQISPIHFIMVHDGAGKPKQESTKQTEDGDASAKILLRGMIWYFNTHKLNVALINRIEFRDSKVFTMIVESSSTLKELDLTMALQFTQEITETKQLLVESQNEHNEESEVPIKDINLEELAGALAEEDLSESTYIAIYTLSEMFLQRDCDIYMVSAFLLHTIASKRLPLSQRRLPLVVFDSDYEEVINKVLAKFSTISRRVIENPLWIDTMDDEEIESDTVDLVDGRLLRVIIKSMCDNSFDGVLPPAFQKDWEAISSIFKKLTKEDISLAGDPEPESSETMVTEAEVEPSMEDLAVLPFSNPVFDRHLECIHVNTDNSLSTRMGAMKIYRETSHWHNHRKPLNPKYAPPQKVSKWR